MNMKSVLKGFRSNQMTQSTSRLRLSATEETGSALLLYNISIESDRIQVRHVRHEGVREEYLYWEELLNWIRRGFSFCTRILTMLMNNKKLTWWQKRMELTAREEDGLLPEQGTHHLQLWMQRLDP